MRLLVSVWLALLIAVCPLICCHSDHAHAAHDSDSAVHVQHSADVHHEEHWHEHDHDSPPPNHTPTTPCDDSKHACICHGATLTAKVRSCQTEFGGQNQICSVAIDSHVRYVTVECVAHDWSQRTFNGRSGRDVRNLLQSHLL